MVRTKCMKMWYVMHIFIRKLMCFVYAVCFCLMHNHCVVFVVSLVFSGTDEKGGRI